MEDHGTSPARTKRVWRLASATVILLAALAILFRATAPPTPTATSEAVAIAPPETERSVPGWSLRAPGPLSPRTGQAAVWTGRELIVFGGRSLRGGNEDGAVYSPAPAASGQWKPIPQAPIDGGPGAAMVWTGEGLYLFTGAAAMFEPAESLWRSLAYPPVTPSHPLTAAWTGTEVVLIGYQVHPPRFENNIFAVAYGPEGECCRRLPDPPIDLSYGRALWTGNRLLLIGGFEGGPRGAASSVGFAAYEPAADTWTTLDPAPLDGRRELSATWTGGSLIAVDYFLRAAEWNPESGWRTLPDVPVAQAQCFPRTTTIEGGVFVWYCRQAAMYDTAAEQWIPIATPDLDPHAVSTSCLPVAAQDVVLMWCGNGDGAEPFFWEIDPDATEARS